jgi:hypothetical protein
MNDKAGTVTGSAPCHWTHSHEPHEWTPLLEDPGAERVLHIGAAIMCPGKPPRGRGTSNGNANGSSEDRRRRRAWLLETYRADVDALVIEYPSGLVLVYDETAHSAAYSAADAEACGYPWRVVPACRCYRCGRLLIDTNGEFPPPPHAVTVDRIVPGCKGGTYRRTNIRPACGKCNSGTGGALSGKVKR